MSEDQNQQQDEQKGFWQIANEAADEVADALDADILLYNGDMDPEKAPDESLIDMLAGYSRRRNVLLILVSNGGDANTAYRIARCLQECYEQFTVFVPGWCKSAGTLIAIGAHELVISDNGQLGPLDVQISKPDELFESGSGLDMIQALDFLKNRAFKMFEDSFLELKFKSGNRLSTKTATEIATHLTTGLFQPVYQQIEPTRLGEIARAMRIAQEYGQRLDEVSDNLKIRALQRLVNGYPTHRFVIDRKEAGELFNRVRPPHSEEQALADALEELSRVPNVHSGPVDPVPFIQFVSSESQEGIGEAGEEIHERQDSGADTGREREETSGTPRGAGQEAAAPRLTPDGKAE